MKESKAGGANGRDLVDLHTHSLLSDGAYLPMELAQRAWCRGYGVIAITDHVDSSSIETVVTALVRAAGEINRLPGKIRVLPGAEITHAPPELIAPLVREARRLGARLVVVHGETLVEPVEPGTNRRAIEAGADILAHPGLISRREVALAREAGVRLEISRRGGHSLGNGHLVSLWRECGGQLVINTDGHRGEDLFTPETYLSTGLGAGLTPEEIERIKQETLALALSL